MMPIIVLGSGNSGSSAIVDYLRGRKDIDDPLNGQEFRLIQEKHGLSCLHRALCQEYHPDNAMYALMDFIKLAKRLGSNTQRWRVPPRLGYGYSTRISGYDQALKDFINSITRSKVVKFPLHDKFKFTTLDWILYKLNLPPISPHISTPKPIPVPVSDFNEKAVAFIERLFLHNPIFSRPNLNGLVFDQGGSFWSPFASTRYYGKKRKVIVVIRDPCDVYMELRHKNKLSARDFAAYYAAVMNNISKDEWNHDAVLRIRFEDFVLENEKSTVTICRFLGIDGDMESSYNPDESRKNIGLYHNLEAEEIEVIRRITSNTIPGNQYPL